jgi:hypothetical protein
VPAVRVQVSQGAAGACVALRCGALWCIVLCCVVCIDRSVRVYEVCAHALSVRLALHTLHRHAAVLLRPKWPVTVKRAPVTPVSRSNSLTVPSDDADAQSNPPPTQGAGVRLLTSAR